MLHVDVKYALEQPRPANAMRPCLDGLDLALGGNCGIGGLLLMNLGTLRHHQRAELGFGGQHAMVREAGVRSFRAAK
jgi:hypothetical protein